MSVEDDESEVAGEEDRGEVDDEEEATEGSGREVGMRESAAASVRSWRTDCI